MVAVALAVDLALEVVVLTLSHAVQILGASRHRKTQAYAKDFKGLVKVVESPVETLEHLPYIEMLFLT